MEAKFKPMVQKCEKQLEIGIKSTEQLDVLINDWWVKIVIQPFVV